MFFLRSKRFAAGPRPLPATASWPIICYVTDRKTLAGGASSGIGALQEKIREAVEAGVDWVQIREKDLPARELLALAREAMAAGAARVIVNDRLDVALAAGAAGVHVGHASVAVAEVAKWCRAGAANRSGDGSPSVAADFLIGVSCHSLQGAREAEKSGASYTYFGPIYETPSKIPFGKPHGADELAEVARAVRIPVIAIGGVNGGNAAECIRAGAAGIAAIRLIQDARDRGALAAAVEAIHGLR
jgi:thiamine-phosphate pyrophosphorylase